MQTHAFIQVLIVGSVWKKVLSSEMKGNASGKYMESATGKDKTGSGWLVLRWPLLVTGVLQDRCHNWPDVCLDNYQGSLLTLFVVRPLLVT